MANGNFYGFLLFVTIAGTHTERGLQQRSLNFGVYYLQVQKQRHGYLNGDGG